MSARETIARMRERAEGATPGPWKLWGMAVMADPVGNSDLAAAIDVAHTLMLVDGKPRTFDAEFIAHARTDLPVLVGVLEAVLAIHREIDDGRGPHCFEDAEDWPCPTTQAIETALEAR